MKLLLLAFLGLPLSTLLWLSGGAFAVTTLLYILRLRRRRTLIAFLKLWEDSLTERKASALKSRLQRLISLLLSLLLVGALIFALGDPRSEAEEDAKTVVVLLDVSASMGTKDGAESRLEDAKKRVEKRIDSLDKGDRMLLIEMGARPRPLLALTDSRSALVGALEGIAVLDVSADLKAGLRLASDALGGAERGEILVVSDGALPEVSLDFGKNPPPVFFESVGEKAPAEQENVGISAFSARRYPLTKDRFEVLIEVQNTGTRVAQVDVSLYAADQEGQPAKQLDRVRLLIEPGARVSQSYPNLDQAEAGLVAQIERVDQVKDAFPQDDIARTLLSPTVPPRVLLVGEPNTFLDAALLVPELVVARVAAEDYPPADSYDITIFDGVFPKRAKHTGAALYVAAAEPSAGHKTPDHFPVEYEQKLEMFGFDTWKKDSMVFRLIDPYDVQVLSGYGLKTQTGDLVLGSSGGRPIFVQGMRPEGAFLALGFSFKKSDFVLRTAFPLFVVNILDELHPQGRADTVLGFRTGTLWRPPTPIKKGQAIVRGPLGPDTVERIVPVEDGHAVLFGQRAGFYELSTGEDASRRSTRFAASLLSSEEASFPTSKKLLLGQREAKPAPLAVPHVERQPWFWLVLVVAAVSFVEWWTFHRRWTV